MKLDTFLMIMLSLLLISSNLSLAQPVSIPIEAIPTKPQPIEIEIKRSSEAIRIEGCKNMCGDGVCQEIVCMMVGCPCPETVETCSQDCLMPTVPEGVKAVPVISFPKEAKVEIVPTREDPILVNERPVEFKGVEAAVLPKISFEIETKALPALPVLAALRETQVQIEIDKATNVIRIEHEKFFATTRETIKVEEKMIKIETPKGSIQVNVLPSVATQIVISRTFQEIKESELKVVDDKPVYEISGIKAGKILWLIPVEVQIQTQVDAQTGAIAKVEQPWWSFLVI